MLPSVLVVGRTLSYQWPCGPEASGSYAAHTGRILADDPLPAVAILNALLFLPAAPAVSATLDEEDAALAALLRRQSLLDPGFEAPTEGGVALQGNAGRGLHSSTFQLNLSRF